MRPPTRRGRPTLRERPQYVAFTPVEPLALRLDPDPEPSFTRRFRWRRNVSLPPCRLVWVGDVVGPPAASYGWHVEALVAPLSTAPSAPALCVLPLPITTLEVLTVGRVLKEEPASEQRFLGSEWSIELWFGPSETSIASLDALGLRLEPLPARYGASPLCVSADPSSGRLVLLPCWKIFRFYYASAPAVARLAFEFPGGRRRRSSRCSLPLTGRLAP
jgi:hypothetical protein